MPRGTSGPLPTHTLGTWTWPTDCRAPMCPDWGAVTGLVREAEPALCPSRIPAAPVHKRWAAQGTVVSPESLDHRGLCLHTACWGRWGGVTMLHWKHPESVNPSPTLPMSMHRTLLEKQSGSCPCSEGLGNRELRTHPGEGERSGSCAGQSQRVVPCPTEPHLENLYSKMELLRTWRWWPQNMNSLSLLNWGFCAAVLVPCLWSNTCLSALVSFPGRSQNLKQNGAWDPGSGVQELGCCGNSLVLSPCCCFVLASYLYLQSDFWFVHVAESQILCFVGSKHWPYQHTWDG